MGRKKKQQQKLPEKDLFRTFADLKNKTNWDQFFKIRCTADYFEWYADWPQLQSLLTHHLSSLPVLLPESAVDAPPSVQPADLNILVPGCGNSKLSEHLYDAGFKQITNVDFSKVVITEMSRRNMTERPEMKWQVMDITVMPFGDKTFDAIIDKGGLDALMVPELGCTPGNQYISKVKRILTHRRKYICLTLGESHVPDIFSSDLLFSMFRFGWKMSLYTISNEPSSENRNLRTTFMVVVEKDNGVSVPMISSFMDKYSVESHGTQAHGFYKAFEREQKFRSELYTLKDLNLGNLTDFEPGRTVKLILGDKGPRFYKGILVDAEEQSATIPNQFAVFVVPSTRVDDWFFSSEEGLMRFAAYLKAARSLIILLDSSNFYASMELIEMDLTHLVRKLVLGCCGYEFQITFMTANEVLKDQVIVHQVTSGLTGTIVVDEVVYLKDQGRNDDDDLNCKIEDVVFRRLTFERTHRVVQSKALLSSEAKENKMQSEALLSSEVEEKKVQTPSKTKKKGQKRKPGSSSGRASSDEGKVDHNYLAHTYHNIIISGLMLISPRLKGSSSTGAMVETVIIGLGAGLLPMFMKNWLPTLNIEVVEVDPVVLDVAQKYFGFTEDGRLRVRIADGLQFVREKADSEAEGESSCSKLDILIVDVNSPELSSGLTCPSADFVEESFLQNAKNSLSEEGLFVINVVLDSPTVKVAIHSSLKKVFGKSLLFLQLLEHDSHEVIFALKNESPITEEDISTACDNLEKSLEVVNHKWTQRVVKASKLIRPLR
ncbi:hypothetical protein ABFX02_14G076000 [Erythranthe guttata]